MLNKSFFFHEMEMIATKTKRRKTKNRMPKLYRRLQELGFSRKYIRKVALPSWWNDELGTNPLAYAEALVLISRHLGVELESLQKDDIPLTIVPANVCFKKRLDTASDDLVVARTVALQAAELAAIGAAELPSHSPADARLIRTDILASGAQWVGFSHLLEYCWDHGIPVLHLLELPPKAKKMDGMAVNIDGRPVILLCRNDKSLAWMLFILAHELGHVMRGHVDHIAILIDEKISDIEQDDEERAANEFATELLTGAPNLRYQAGSRWLNAKELASIAKTTGKQEHVDPGHIALNYGEQMSHMGVARAALKVLETGKDAQDVVNDILNERLDWSAIPGDSAEFLSRVTRAEPNEDITG